MAANAEASYADELKAKNDALVSKLDDLVERIRLFAEDEGDYMGAVLDMVADQLTKLLEDSKQ